MSSYHRHPSFTSQHPKAGGRRYNSRGQGHSNGHQRSAAYGTSDLESRLTALLMKVGDRVDSADPSVFTDQMTALVDILLADLDGSSGPHIRQVFARCIVEFPMKTPMYATLAALINARVPRVGETLLKGECLSLLQSSLTSGDWRATKLLLRFYAQSTLTNSLTLSSFHALVQPFVQELQSISPSTALLRDRGDALALTLLQVLPYGGQPLLSTDGLIFTVISHWMIRRVEGSDQPIARSLPLLTPYPPTQDSSSSLEPPYPVVEGIQGWYEAVQAMIQKEERKEEESTMTDLDNSSKPASSTQSSVSILLQPHVYFDATLTKATPVNWGDQEEKEESDRMEDASIGADASLPAKAISTTLPSPKSVEWWVLHDIVGDTIDLYECNRREGLRLLVTLPEQCVSGTFRPLQIPLGRDPLDEDESEEGDGKAWRLEALILQVVFARLLSLPSIPSRHVVAYSTLTSDLMRPQTRFPLVYGKAIRSLFSRLGSMDLECSRRLAEAFSHHLSNHTFYWNWTTWADQLKTAKEEGEDEDNRDASLESVRESQKTFIREAILRMTWLSYHDRIKSTLPEDWVGQGPERLIPADITSRPILTASPSSPEGSSDPTSIPGLVQSLREGLRLRKDLLVVEKQVKAFIHPESPELEDGMAQEEETRHRRIQARDALFECILEHGIKSTSHMLGALERYLPLLRDLGVREDGDAGKGLVDLTVRYWGGHGGFLRIVLDKMVTYRVIGAKEVIDWVLGQDGSQDPETGVNVYAYYYPWEVVDSLLDRAVARVSRYTRARIDAEEALKQDGLRRAAELNGTEAQEEDIPMTSGQVELHTAVREAVEGKEWAEKEIKDFFIPSLRLFLTRMQSHLAHSGQNTESDRVWVTLRGWFREMCRRFWRVIGGMLVTLETIVFMGPEIDGRGEWNPRVKQEIDMVVQFIKDRQAKVLG
ncbi:MIF4G like-domain-containing protein [Piptocephalis cylindrospora]|uniref:MIF4G like-domain-containing protein n=1 Tax=Piptocephalis cylindrospora TaxID=1907219 RepID=A0A4P9Y6B8_9FUNG|nr:MIF4G like-domain-containing protein [Piptocephalis cylindrospora]|eukprot:RKP14626.1 MIF4G like-domain-containing protein [Piptocephalis cylindrospora]